MEEPAQCEENALTLALREPGRSPQPARAEGVGGALG